MKGLLLYLAGIALSLLSIWGAALLAFVNPANWTNYFKDYSTRDYIFVFASNITILILLLAALFTIWRTLFDYPPVASVRLSRIGRLEA